MRLKSLNIKNYRQFCDSVFKFDKNTAYDFHIIVGKQGVGKTNFINSISWLLYGQELFSRFSGTDENGILNWNLLDSISQKHTATIRGTFEDRVEKREVIITRSAEFTISREGNPYIYEKSLTFLGAGANTEVSKYGADAQMIIDSHFPPLVRDHFFFDGESLDTYFASTTGGKVKEVIYRLSQIEKTENIKENTPK